VQPAVPPRDWSVAAAAIQRGQPCHHDQPVGPLDKVSPLGTRHGNQVLIDQRRDGNLAEIDPLRPRQFEQQVQRTLEAVQGDKESVRAGFLDFAHGTKLPAVDR
jgi:hypothetical protein